MSIIDWKAAHGDFFSEGRALVTGGAGFIGSHLVEALVSLNARVVVLDDLSGGSESNLNFGPGKPGTVQFVRGSINNPAILDEVVRGCRWVFHQAALGSVPRSIEIPQQYHATNIIGTGNVLEASRHAGVKRMMFAASSSAYGDTEVLPKTEDMPVRPKSPYAASKVACEAMMYAYAKCYALDTVCLRYFNIFGPRQNANSAYAAVIAAFAKSLLSGKRPVIFGDGLQSRDFAFVDNAVQANLLAARAHDRIGGETINIACGRRITVNELAEQMAQLLGRANTPIDHTDPRGGDVLHSLADLKKARSILGYEPLVNFEQGLAVTSRWYAEAAGQGRRVAHGSTP